VCILSYCCEPRIIPCQLSTVTEQNVHGLESLGEWDMITGKVGLGRFNVFEIFPYLFQGNEIVLVTADPESL